MCTGYAWARRRSPSNTRHLPVYSLRPSGSPETELLQTLLPYVALRSRPALAGDKTLPSLAHLLR